MQGLVMLGLIHLTNVQQKLLKLSLWNCHYFYQIQAAA
jgi:hypothetical protein